MAGTDGLRDLYGLLGVRPEASDDEIKKAYRARARELHPDTNPGDAVAEAKFKEVTVAYEVLRDPEKRARYDRFGPEGVFGGQPGAGGFGFEGGLGDIFEAFFGQMAGGGGRRRGPAPGSDAEVRIGLEFAEAVFGCRKEISVRLPATCAACTGRGTAPGTEPVVCPDCQGAGEIRRVRQSLLGQVVTSAACPRCAGTGRDHPAPVPRVRGRGPAHGGADLHRRGAGRGGQRLDPAAGRAGRGGTTRRLHGLALRAPGGHARPPFRTRERQPPHHLDHRDGPGGAGHRGGGGNPRGHPRGGPASPGPSTGSSSGSGERACPTCAAAAGATSSCTCWSRRRPRSMRPKRSCSASSPRPGASRSRRRARVGTACSRGSALRLARPVAQGSPHGGRHRGACRRVGPGLRGGSRPPRPLARRRPSSRPGAAPAGRRGGHRERRGGPLGPHPLDGEAGGPAARLALAAVDDGTGPGGDGSVQFEAAPSPALTVAFAPTKGERPEWVVQKLTELGIDRVVPLVSERSVVRWSGARGQGAVERLRRVAREAAAQCRRVWLPEITEVMRFDALGSLAAPGEVVLAQLSGDRLRASQLVVAVGPEGGWSADELASGLPTVGFGLSVLAGRDGRRDGRSAHGVTPHGYGCADGADDTRGGILLVGDQTEWLGTKEASARLGITLRSLYRFIDEGDLAAYKFGRVIRMKVEDVDRFIESCRIQPGQLEHLYPPLKVSDTD